MVVSCGNAVALRFFDQVVNYRRSVGHADRSADGADWSWRIASLVSYRRVVLVSYQDPQLVDDHLVVLRSHIFAHIHPVAQNVELSIEARRRVSLLHREVVRYLRHFHSNCSELLSSLFALVLLVEIENS